MRHAVIKAVRYQKRHRARKAPIGPWLGTSQFSLTPMGTVRVRGYRAVGQLIKLPQRFSPLIYGIIQSCLTCAVAAAVAHSTDPFGTFFIPWIRTWVLSCMMTFPIVILAVPIIRKIVDRITGKRSR